MRHWFRIYAASNENLSNEKLEALREEYEHFSSKIAYVLKLGDQGTYTATPLELDAGVLLDIETPLTKVEIG